MAPHRCSRQRSARLLFAHASGERARGTLWLAIRAPYGRSNNREQEDDMIRFVTAIVIGLFVSSAPFAQQAPSIAKPIAEKKGDAADHGSDFLVRHLRAPARRPDVGRQSALTGARIQTAPKLRLIGCRVPPFSLALYVSRHRAVGDLERAVETGCPRPPNGVGEGELRRI